MKKTFVIQVEYPDNDVILSEEVMEVTQECIEHHMERYFGANIMDGDYDRIKVREITEFIFLVRKMRIAQEKHRPLLDVVLNGGYLDCENAREYVSWGETKRMYESEVDEYLKKMES